MKEVKKFIKPHKNNKDKYLKEIIKMIFNHYIRDNKKNMFTKILILQITKIQYTVILIKRKHIKMIQI